MQPVVLKTLNVITYIIMVTTAALHWELLSSIYYDRPNYLRGTQYSMILPGIVFVLLAGFSIAQWRDSAYDYVMDAIEYNLFASNLVITTWVFTWKLEWLVVSQILVIINAIFIGRLFMKKQSFTATSLIDYIFVHLPFSIYAGLVWVNVFQSFFSSFTTKEAGPDSWAAIGAAGSIVFMLIIANYQAQFSQDPDSWSAIVIGL
ncbi:hypothetical protein BGZ65_012387 [Modicella reniformis]|uniref:Uncharacterized protein n=1 Tax=Modicella reniformis TaxID=1440133 RepID=A0A9P6JF64_9FUNG|nr:hypothetical protein BGZ65_012387 [Modicella reniformis]